MTDTTPSLLIETDMLEDILYSKDVLIVDLGKADTYRKLHIPGAVFVDYGQIVAASKPVMGLLPDDGTLQRIFSSLGIGRDTYVVAYDDEGGGRAARFLWTLEVAGHTRFALLNGGLHAWANEGHPYDDAALPDEPDDAEPFFESLVVACFVSPFLSSPLPGERLFPERLSVE